MSLNVSLELRFIIEKSRTQVASIFTARCDLSLYRDSVRAEMVIQLCYRVKLLRTLTAHILLDLMVCLHVIIQVGDLSKGSAAIHLNAHKWTLAGVKSSVVVEICYLRECFAAVDAKRQGLIKDTFVQGIWSDSPNIRTIVGMNSFVIAQISLL